jgi:hypothetical protein
VRPYLSRRCLLLHATLLVLLPAFAWLTDWQLHRAEGGNSLSWAYVFLWPCFAVYAVYTWWNLVRDDVARQRGEGRDGPVSSAVPGSAADDRDGLVVGAPSSPDRPPGWALTGGRKKNIAIAAAAPIDAERGGKGERFTPQTEDEATRLAEYNRYLAALNAQDEAEDARRASGRAR